MIGRRIEWRPGFPGSWARPGDYCRVPDDAELGRAITWMVMDPTGHCGSIIPENHTFVEHDDGTVTFTPSLIMPGGWHGALRCGVWS